MSIYSLPHIPAEGINVTIAANNINVDTLQLGHPQYLQQFPFYWGVDCSYITTFTTVYKLNYTWVITLMLASTVLAATGLVGIFASLAIRGPDVFDPVIGQIGRAHV